MRRRRLTNNSTRWRNIGMITQALKKKPVKVLAGIYELKLHYFYKHQVGSVECLPKCGESYSPRSCWFS